MQPLVSNFDKVWIRQRLGEIKSIYDQFDINDACLDKTGGLLSIFYYLYGKEFQDRKAMHRARQIAKRIEVVACKDLSAVSILNGPLEAHIVLRIWDELGFLSSRYARRLPRLKEKLVLSFKEMQNEIIPELVSGSVGIALAAHAQNNLPLERLCLRHIESRIVKSDWGFGVPWSDPHLPKERRRVQLYFRLFNLGLAHGLPGILALHSVYPRTGSSIIKKRLVRTLSNVEEETHSEGFPVTFPSPKLYAGRGGKQSAWCYGDAGVGYALILANPKSQLARKVLLRGTDPSKWKNPVRDEHFCHGASGLAQISLRSFQKTRDPAIRKNYLFWLRKLRGKSNQWQFLKNLDSPGLRSESLLFGYLGIGLTLFSSIVEDDCAWDRYLLFSIPRKNKNTKAKQR